MNHRRTEPEHQEPLSARKGMANRLIQALLLAVMLLGLPLAGVILTGQSVSPYLQFPPETSLVEHAPFSWTVFALLAMAIFAALVPFLIWCILSTPSRVSFKRVGQGYPWWGTLGLALIAAAWFLGWNRFDWFAWGQLYTFPFLWFGYILVVNGLTSMRSGHCMLLDQPARFGLLFPVSAVFWWFFEYLNRFVENWAYVQVERFSALEYVVYASVCFSTVLPAVLGTRDFLASFPFFDRFFTEVAPVQPGRPKAWATGLLIISGAGLALIGVWPDQLFPLLWVSPLVIIISSQTLLGEGHTLSPVTRGNWSQAVTAALAALICGFFWEMWNFYSLAKWVYSIPYVQRFHIFEMPILGYAGYLPFGLECAVIGDWVLKRGRRK
jgi:hypothetical protein